MDSKCLLCIAGDTAHLGGLVPVWLLWMDGYGESSEVSAITGTKSHESTRLGRSMEFLAS